MNLDFKNYLLKLTQATACKELEVIQSLWSGYGSISRFELTGASISTVVVKHINLNQSSTHPRGWDTDKGHQRKVKSYQVEEHWYKNWNQRCNLNCKTPNFMGSFTQAEEQWIILEDLDVAFPLRKQELEFSEVMICLKWLAHFHATFMGQKPLGLWEVGTYWHLATRPDELEKMENAELKAKAHDIDTLLNNSKFQTLVHGDAKLANFCFSKDGKMVAAVDFQYVGGGCGMKDVAYFLGSCLSSNESELYEKELLNFYFSELQKGLKSTPLNVDFLALEQEWRIMYPLACADFTRFLLGWMPTHQKINKYQLRVLDLVLAGL